MCPVNMGRSMKYILVKGLVFLVGNKVIYIGPSIYNTWLMYFNKSTIRYQLIWFNIIVLEMETIERIYEFPCVFMQFTRSIL